MHEFPGNEKGSEIEMLYFDGSNHLRSMFIIKNDEDDWHSFFY